MKYYTEQVDYPRALQGEILPWGVEWNYIGHLVLAGFSLYAKPISLFMLERYSVWDALPEQDDYIHNLKFGFDTTKHTRIDTFNALVEDITSKDGDISYHDLNSLDDDFLMLGKINDCVNGYLTFWYDKDVSDCCIGRFKTEDSEEEVIAEFNRYVNSLDFKHHVVDKQILPNMLYLQ